MYEEFLVRGPAGGSRLRHRPPPRCGLRAPCPPHTHSSDVFFLLLFLLYLSHGPSPVMLCVSACEVHVHGHLLAVILRFRVGRSASPLSPTPGPGVGTSVHSARRPVVGLFGDVASSAPPPPQENTHRRAQSDAWWVGLRRTPTLGARLRHCRSAVSSPWPRPSGPAERRGLSPGQVGPSPSPCL